MTTNDRPATTTFVCHPSIVDNVEAVVARLRTSLGGHRELIVRGDELVPDPHKLLIFYEETGDEGFVVDVDLLGR